MYIKAEELRQGDVLVGQSILMSTALLLEKGINLDEGRLLDFCTLIKALALHDRLVTLPAYLPEYLKNTRLYKYLQNKNRPILFELDIDYKNLIERNKKDMEELLEDVFGNKFSTDDLNIVLGQKVAKKELEYAKMHYTQEDKSEDGTIFGRGIAGQQRRRFIQEIIERKRSDWNIEDTRQLLESIDHVGTRIAEPTALRPDIQYFEYSLLRTAVYLEISSTLSVPFLPDFSRIPTISGYNHTISQSVSMFISSNIDENKRKELEAARSIAVPWPIPIPDIALNFLNSYYNTASIEESLDYMRQKFQDKNKAIVNLERKLERASKISSQETLSVMHEIKDSLSATQGSDLSEIAVSATAAISSDLENLVLSGIPGTSGTEFGIAEIINRIRRWQKKSRIIYFDTAKKEAARVTNQDELLKNAFGDILSPKQKVRFLRLTDKLGEIMQPASF